MWSIVTEFQLALDGNYDRGSCLKHVGTEGRKVPVEDPQGRLFGDVATSEGTLVGEESVDVPGQEAGETPPR
jgi:hypothetical protein